MKMSYVVFGSVFLLTVLLTGCSDAGESRLNEYAIAKRVAFESLSPDERKSILPWKGETVMFLPISKVPGYVEADGLSSEASIYKVQFFTSKDEFVGPIGVFVDVLSESVVGCQIRN